MKKITIFIALTLIAFVTFAQFSNTEQLKTFITDTIKDRRPDKVTAAQLQKALIGISNFLTPDSIYKKFQSPIDYENTIRIGYSEDPDILIQSVKKFENFVTANTFQRISPTGIKQRVNYEVPDYFAQFFLESTGLDYEGVHPYGHEGKMESKISANYQGLLLSASRSEAGVFNTLSISPNEGVKITAAKSNAGDPSQSIEFIMDFNSPRMILSNDETSNFSIWKAENTEKILEAGYGFVEVFNLLLADKFSIPISATPTSSTDINYTQPGMINWDDNYIYITTSTGLIKRIDLSSF